MTRHFNYHPIASEGDNQRAGSSAPVVSRLLRPGIGLLEVDSMEVSWWIVFFLPSVTLYMLGNIHIYIRTHICLRLWTPSLQFIFGR